MAAPRTSLVEDLSNPLEVVRKDLVSLVDTLTRIRRLVKHPGRGAALPEASRNEGKPIEEFIKESADMMVSREEFEEHVSNLLARLHECRAHAALANKSLARVIELGQPLAHSGSLS